MSDKEKAVWDQIPSLDLEMDGDYAKKLKAKEGRRHHRSDFSSLKTVFNNEVPSLPIKIATTANGVFEGFILDLSESGCKLVATEKLEKGEPAKVGFVINQRTVVAKAIVRWVSPRGSGCTAGLEFRGVSDEIKEFLGTLISASLFNKIGKVK
jgi:hypothetical protein